MYLKVDVLLLAFLFETFRKESINYFELDPVHNLSTPGYRWDAMLRLADINLKPISDKKKYLFIENVIRSGVSIICRSYIEANDKI